MCTSSPEIPAPKQAQESQQAATMDQRRRARKAAQVAPQGTFLTGPDGSAPGANTGASTLLGS